MTPAEPAQAVAPSPAPNAEVNPLKALKARGVPVERPQGRNMWIIRLACHRVFDFWPTTGRWRERDVQMNRAGMAWNRPAKQEGQGIQALLVAIGDAR